MATRMKWEHIIHEDGTVETHVLERQEGVQCNAIKQFTNGLGQEVNDEQTGPEGDDVHEVQL
jgi:hypothetical protein